MPMQYGNILAKNVSNGTVNVGGAAWVPLVASGTTPKARRQWIQIQMKSPGALCLGYSNINSDGTFTAPTYNGTAAKIIVQAAIWTEPLSDSVMLWGRYTAKGGATAGGCKVVVTEYA